MPQFPYIPELMGPSSQLKPPRVNASTNNFTEAQIQTHTTKDKRDLHFCSSISKHSSTNNNSVSLSLLPTKKLSRKEKEAILDFWNQNFVPAKLQNLSNLINASDLEKSNYIVLAKKEGQIIGTLAAARLVNSQTNSISGTLSGNINRSELEIINQYYKVTDPNSKILYAVLDCVDQDHRRQGLSREMYKTLASISDQIICFSSCKNHGSTRSKLRNGFEIISNRDDHYKNFHLLKVNSEDLLENDRPANFNFQNNNDSRSLINQNLAPNRLAAKASRISA